MENYDETMNYSFEPERQDPWERPTEKNKKPGKKRTWLKITLILLAVAIVAGAAGVTLSGVIRNLGQRNEEALRAAEPTADRQEEEQQIPVRYELQAAALPETLKTHSGEKELKPKDVYKMNVGACCGVATQITTNVYGQTTTGACAGSGFVISEDGYICTNNHVVENATSVSIKLYDGTEYPAEIIGTDAMNDVALLKIDAQGLQSVYIGDSEDLEVGDEVIAIGNPLGELTFTMTQGYVSALDREINIDGTPINMLQTDAAINSGNSGGPLFDMNGNVVGITSAKYSGSSSSGAGIEGIGFAIPINDVLRIVYDLQEYGYVRNRAYLGVTVKDLDKTTAANYNLPVGPMIQSVLEGSCTEKAGILPNDIIIGFDGEDVTCYTELAACLRKCRAGDTVLVKVYRGGAELEFPVTLDERPQDTETQASAQTENQPEEEEQTPDPQPQVPDQTLPEDGTQIYPWGDDFGIEDFFRYFYGNGFPFGYGSNGNG